MGVAFRLDEMKEVMELGVVVYSFNASTWKDSLDYTANFMLNT